MRPSPPWFRRTQSVARRRRTSCHRGQSGEMRRERDAGRAELFLRGVVFRLHVSFACAPRERCADEPKEQKEEGAKGHDDGKGGTQCAIVPPMPTAPENQRRVTTLPQVGKSRISSGVSVHGPMQRAERAVTSERGARGHRVRGWRGRGASSDGLVDGFLVTLVDHCLDHGVAVVEPRDPLAGRSPEGELPIHAVLVDPARECSGSGAGAQLACFEARGSRVRFCVAPTSSSRGE